MSKNDNGLYKNTDIAVVGMACWYPGAKNLIEFWENILAKRRQFRRILDQRLPLSDYYSEDRSAPDKTYSSQAAFIDGFEFDWNQNRFPKTAYESTDLVHWLALDISYKAIRDASLSRDSIPSNKTGVIVGNSLTGDSSRSNGVRLRWPFFEKVLREAASVRGMEKAAIDELLHVGEKICKDSLAPITEDTLAGSLANTIAGRISNYFDVDGGGFTVDGACASSLLAVANGASSLASGDLDLAIVGGVDLSIDPFEIIGFAKVGALAENEMRVYDREGRGFIPGEGCGFVILKRMSDAVRDKDRIYATLKGWGISSDGSGGITAPKSSGQAKAIQRAYEKAGYSIDSCQFIEGHGTGTAVGDKRELEGLSMAAKSMGGASSRSIGMTSLKSVIGHTKAAAGIGAFIKATMGVNRRVAPPTSGCENKNPVFDEGAEVLFPLIKGIQYKKNEKMRAGVSAMGFGGINCHVTLESYGEPCRQLEPSIPEQALMASHSKHEIFVFTTQTVAKLREDINKLEIEAQSMSYSDLTDLAAHQASVASATMPFRAVVIASQPKELIKKLEVLKEMTRKMPGDGKFSKDVSNSVWLSNKTHPPRLGFVFPGQGSQRLNMSRVLTQRFRWARKMTSQADSLLSRKYKFKISDHIFKNLERAETPEVVDQWNLVLRDTRTAQPGICLASSLWAKRLEDLGLIPDVVCGHSLGEVTALHWAGSYDFKTMIELSALRGQLMHSEGESAGTMLSLACDKKMTGQLIEETQLNIEIANINSPKQTVVSGSVDDIEKLLSHASGKGITCHPLKVSNAFHSQFVKQASDAFYKEISLNSKNVNVNKKFISSVENSEFDGKTDIRKYLADQIVSPVDFISLTEKLHDQCDLIIEVGPGSVLSALVKSQGDKDSVQVFAVESEAEKEFDSLKAIAGFFAMGGDLRLDRLFINRLTRPFVPFAEKIFIENPCEKKLVIADELKLQTNPLPEANNSPRPVERVMPSATPTTVPQPVEPAPASNVVPLSYPSKKGELMTKSDVQENLMNVLVDVTGFSSDAFNMDMRLLDDLNLDSIKAGEVVTQISQICSIEMTTIDPIQLANATLDEIVDMIVALKPTHGVVESQQPINLAVGSTYEAAQPVTAPRGAMPSSPAITSAPMELVKPSSTAPEQSEGKDSETILFDSLARVTGFDRSILNHDMRLLDDLNLDSIKAGEVISDLRSQFPNAGEIDPIQFANATIQDIIDFFAESATSGQQAVPAVSSQQNSSPAATEKTQSPVDVLLRDLMKEVAFQTSYNVDSLTAESNVSDDLRLTISQVTEIMRKVFAKHLIPFHVDPIRFEKKTLKELSQIALSVKQNQQSNSLGGMTEDLKEEPAWVRNFKLVPVKRQRPSLQRNAQSDRVINDLTKAKVLIVHDAEKKFVEALKDETLKTGAICKTTEFENIPDFKDQELAEFSYVIYVQDREQTEKLNHRERLESVVARLHFLANLPRDKESTRRQTTVTCLQFGDGKMGYGDNNPDYSLTNFPSFFQTLNIERSEIRVRSIEIGIGLEDRVACKEVLQELISVPNVICSGFDTKGERWELESQLSRSSTYSQRKIEWSKQDVILVTGGGKGITAECALRFAQETGVRLALVGSSKLPQDGSSNEVTKNLARFKKASVEAQYFSCDITDSSAVESLLAQVTQNMGPISGVIHGAGRNTPARTSQVSPEKAVEEISPKVLGILNVIEHLDSENLKLVTAFTSIIGVMGVPGNAWYGMANHSLKHIVSQYGELHPHVQTVCCAFGMWDEVGMAARLDSGKRLASTGAKMIPLQEGVQRFMDLAMKNPAEDQIIVTSRLWKQSILAPQKAQAKSLRFLENIVAATKGVETISRVKLSLEKDLYLNDHKYEKSYLFPAVFGLEAMAQVALFTLGEQRIKSLKFEDLEFKSAIIIRPNKPTEIEIVAHIAEEQEADGSVLIQVNVRSETSHFQRDSFVGKIRINREMQAEEHRVFETSEPLKLSPQQDLYGDLLFHGPAYQQIAHIYELEEDQVGYGLKCEQEEEVLRRCFVDPQQKLVLGDPFCRDSLLQSLQLVSLDKVVLPIECKNWEIFDTSFHQKPIQGLSCALEKKEKRIVNSVTAFTEAGQVVEKLTGAQAVVIKPHKNDFSKIRSLIGKKGSAKKNPIIDLVSQFTFISGQKPAKAIVKKVPGLKDFTKQKRHELEKEWLSECLKSQNRPEVQLNWDSSGKPIVSGNENLHLSFTHTQDFCVCVLGETPVGVDLELKQTKTDESWKSLLGPKGAEIFESLREEFADSNELGAYLWSAREALFKLVNHHEFTLDHFKPSKNGGVFFIDSKDQKVVIQVSNLTLSKDEQFVFAQAMYPGTSKTDDEGIPVPHSDAYKVGFSEDKGLYIRWPIAFKDSSSPHRNLYFTKFGEWMGRTREIAFWPLLGEASEIFKAGDSGWVTNHSETRVFCSMQVGDMMEVRVSSSEISGSQNSTVELVYDWYRIDGEGLEHLAAQSRMQITWVEVIGHGVVKVAPFPDNFLEFFSTVASSRGSEFQSLPESLLGDTLFEAPKGINTDIFLTSQVFQTSLEDSNLVGNIYFSNYLVWQGRTRDRFLEAIAPGCLDLKSQGEPHSTRVHLKHLRELMPFESVMVEMKLRRLSENGFILFFEYFKYVDGVKQEKLAFSEHEVVWTDSSRNGLSSIPLPQVLKYYLMKEAVDSLQAKGVKNVS